VSVGDHGLNNNTARRNSNEESRSKQPQSCLRSTFFDAHLTNYHGQDSTTAAKKVPVAAKGIAASEVKSLFNNEIGLY
jgi:hypothetical protein